MNPLLAPMDAEEIGRKVMAPTAEAVAAERRARVTAASVAEMKAGWRQPKLV